MNERMSVRARGLSRRKGPEVKAMRVLGIDPGTAITGWGVISEGPRGIAADGFGAITTPSDWPMPRRLSRVFDAVAGILEEFKPDVMAVEQLFFNRNVTTAITVGQARGVAVLAAEKAGVPVVEYAPLAVKMAVVGYGRADKIQIQQMVRLLLGLDKVPSPDDVADALAVGICHLNSCGLAAALARQGARGGR